MIPGAAHSSLGYSDFFDSSDEISLDNGVFRVYSSGLSEASASPSTQPLAVFVLIHGAAQAALSWAVSARALRDLAAKARSSSKSSSDSGSSGSSSSAFPVSRQSVTGSLDFAVVAPDLRGHGHSRHPDPSGNDAAGIGIDTLTCDVERILRAMHAKTHCQTGSISDDTDNRDAHSSSSSSSRPWRLILVGHSLGGAVATHLCATLSSLSSSSPPAGDHEEAAMVAVNDDGVASRTGEFHSSRVFDEHSRPGASVISLPSEATLAAAATAAGAAAGGAGEAAAGPQLPPLLSTSSQLPPSPSSSPPPRACLALAPRSVLSVACLAVLDCVEGTALASLDRAPQALASMPPRFVSQAHAVAWVHSMGVVRNLEVRSLLRTSKKQNKAKTK